MDKHHLDSRQHHAGIDVLELGRHPLADVLRLLDVRGRVVGQRGQDGDPPPLGALRDGHEQLLEHRGRDDEGLGLGCGLVDLGQRLDRVGDDHGVRVADELLQDLEEAVLDAHGRVEVEQLGDADGGRLAHVGALVAEGLAQRLLHVVDHLVDPDAAHRPYGQGSYERVRVF